MAAFTTVDNPELYFQTKLYTGNGSTQSITLDGDTDMQPNMIWFKRRDDVDQPKLHDSVRGVAARISPNADSAEVDDDDVITAFDSDGFSLGDDDSSNASSATHVAWCWKESATAGFDIVSWTGDGSAGTKSHNLSAIPKTIWVKERSNDTNWAIYHQGTGNEDFLKFNTNADIEDTDNWNDTTPTSSVFSLGSGGQTNTSSRTYIAYVFANVQGYSKFGTYIGNGNDNGEFVNTGFRPAFLILKRYGTTGSWFMFDNKRLGYNVDNERLFVDATNTEADTDCLDLLSNGFKIRNNDGDYNSSGGTYIFMAFAEAPFVNSNGVPCNAR